MRNQSIKILLTAIAVLALTSWVAAEQSVVEPGQGESSGSRVMVFPSEGGAYLGVDVQDVTSDRLSQLKLKEERGAEIEMVDQDAPAGKAGLREHDVILSFNGEPVESVEQLHRMIRETPAGRSLALGISRDGQAMTVQVKLADRAKAFHYNMPAVGRMPAMPAMPAMPVMPEIPEIDIPNLRVYSPDSTRAGLLVENLTPQLGEFFGLKNGDGVLVKSVEKGSAAAAAGFHAGDVIVRVEKSRITSRSDWNMALRTHRSGKVSVSVIRDKREQVLPLTLPARKSNSDESEFFEYEMPEFQFETPDIHLTQKQLIGLRNDAARVRAQAQLSRIDLAKIQAAIAEANRAVKKQLRELQQMRPLSD